MMRRREDGLDAEISRALLRQAQSLQVTSADEERIRCSVHRKIEEESGMRKWNTRKIIVAAAAICVLGSITAIAAGKVTQSVGYSSRADDFTYDKLGEIETKLGFATKAPESFSNGYHFTTGTPGTWQDMDDEGNVVEQGEDISLYYAKDGMPEIFVMVQKKAAYEEEPPYAQTFDHDGIKIGFREDHYRFVPPNYQISAEEQAMMDAGELSMSYGSDQVEDKISQMVSWKDNGIRYDMLIWDSTLTAEDLAQMAGEIIDNK